MNDDLAADLMQRVAGVALMYYPDIQASDPTFNLIDELDWCFEETTDLPDEQRHALRELAMLAIVDPTQYREQFCDAMYRLDAGE